MKCGIFHSHSKDNNETKEIKLKTFQSGRPLSNQEYIHSSVVGELRFK